jgi:hypothetical protein
MYSGKSPLGVERIKEEPDLTSRQAPGLSTSSPRAARTPEGRGIMTALTAFIYVVAQLPPMLRP